MFCRAEDELSLNLTRVRIVLENSANISLSPLLCLSVSFSVPPDRKGEKLRDRNQAQY